MKYIHDGQNYVLWLATSDVTHYEMALRSGIQAIHAGFVRFGKEGEKPLSTGYSSSLRLNSKPFDIDPVTILWVTEEYAEMPVICNNKELLENMGYSKIEPAIWKESKESSSWSEVVKYPGLPNSDLSSMVVNFKY